MPMTANPRVPPVCLYSEYSITLEESIKNAHLEIEINRPCLSDLPGIMRKMGWEVAPKLMDRWFASPAFELVKDIRDAYNRNPLIIPQEHVDESTVTLAWARKFSSYTEAVEQLWEKRIDRGALAKKLKNSTGLTHTLSADQTNMKP